MSDSPIVCEIDLEAEGKQTGYLRLPHSVHRSAYGHLPIPAACIANGAGPRVLLMGGTHGDEYEGQIILSELICELQPADVRGRIVFLPMANFPAAMAGLRTSPIDGLNLNRTYPGDPLGTPTPVISHYVENVLLPRMDYLFDLHSGGSSLNYVNALLVPHHDPDPLAAIRQEVIAAFGLPYTMVFGQGTDAGTYSSAAAFRKGVCCFCTEIGGAGTVTKDYLDLAKQGLLRALNAIGSTAVEVPDTALRSRVFRNTILLKSPEPGLFEPLLRLGQDVEAGRPAARIHYPETPGKAPVEVAVERDGTVLAVRVPARLERGDCLYQIAYN
jgi:predicted deacylase